MIKSTNNGQTWSAPQTIIDPVKAGKYSELCAFGGDEPTARNDKTGHSTADQPANCRWQNITRLFPHRDSIMLTVSAPTSALVPSAVSSPRQLW